MEDKKYETLGYIVASTYRTRTVKSLQNGKKFTPTNLAKKSKIRKNHISKTLKELKQQKVARCINKDMRKGKLYTLTPFGEEIAKIIREMEE